MRLRVGELARRTGLTVRTLHHYDEIGLLTPSARSESGYRLYDPGDVQRLHGIQALRHMGLPLAHIATLLGDAPLDPQRLLSQQIQALDLQIQQASELRDRLAVMRDGMAAGTPPELGNWLDTLVLMSTYGKYFSAAELQRIFERWPLVEAEWRPVSQQVRAAMEQGLPVDAPQVQQLANRWMVLMLEWMDGDLDLMDRWGHMYRAEPTTHSLHQAPSGAVIAYVERAIALRMELMGRYLTRDDIGRLGFVSVAQWQALEDEVNALLARRTPHRAPAAQAAVQHWSRLMDQLSRNDTALRARLLAGMAADPLLRAGGLLSTPVREFIGAAATLSLDPHAA